VKTPKYRRHPNGQAFVYHRSINRPQHRLYLGVYDSPASHRRYRAFVAGLVEIDRGADVVHQAGSMGAAVAAWRDETGRGFESRAISVALAALDSFAALPCYSFGPQQLLQVRAGLAAKYARSTANRHLSRIKGFVRWGCLAGWFPADAWARLSVVRGLRLGELGVRESPGVQPVAWSDVVPVLEFLAPPVRCMVRLQYWCGMRPGEVVQVTRAALDMSGPIWLYRPPLHKNSWRGSSLVKAIPPALHDEVRGFFVPQIARPLFRPGDSLAWHGRRGRRGINQQYTAATYRQAVAYGLDALGSGPRWSPGQLRHGIATELARAAGVESAQRWLGHARLATTELYAQRSAAELVELAGQVDSLIRLA